MNMKIAILAGVIVYYDIIMASCYHHAITVCV